MTNISRPANTHGLNTICSTLMSGLTPAKVSGPSAIMPCFSISWAAALVITVKRMKGRYFMSVGTVGPS